MDATVELKAVLKLIFMLFTLAVLFHLIACIFWMSIKDRAENDYANDELKWVP